MPLSLLRLPLKKDPDNFDANFTAGQVMLRCDLSLEGSTIL